LDGLTWDDTNKKRKAEDIALPMLTEKANEIADVKLIKKQVEEILLSKGFKVTNTHGNKYVRSNSELIDSLV
jgi:hypothetical protein